MKIETPYVFRVKGKEIPLDPEILDYIQYLTNELSETAKEKNSLKIENYKLHGKINRMFNSSCIERLFRIGKFNWE